MSALTPRSRMRALHFRNKRTRYSTLKREMIWTVPESLRRTSRLLAVELWLIRTLIIIIITQVYSISRDQ